jgi:hypothetical protein
MDNQTTQAGAAIESTQLFDVSDLCRRESIELRGDDGQPFCCGVRMRVKVGMFGHDSAECLTCGKMIGNAASPHINGGFIPSGEWIKEHGNKTWYLMRPSNANDQTAGAWPDREA